MDRRSFLKATVLGAGTMALGPSFWSRVLAQPAVEGPSPYGPLLAPDANGLRLPAGFSSRVIAKGGEPVPGTSYPWHFAPDGGAVFPVSDGGWIYVSNSEVPFAGGASAIRFRPDGTVAGAHRILIGTSLNCAGGPTPWGKWLSCEEHPEGMVWECDPLGLNFAPRPALGIFSHEAAAVDPVLKHVYLTEDESDGCFYRFTPARYPDLSAGTLEVMVVEPGDPTVDPVKVSWKPVPRPVTTPLDPTRRQVGEASKFNGGEGLWYDSGSVYFTTKGDHRVWRYRTKQQLLEVLWDGRASGGPLKGVDNVTLSPRGDLVVAEDGDDMQLCLITKDRVCAPLLQVTEQKWSEIAGPAFSPDGTRLYFSSQRGPANQFGSGQGQGITYEVTGPFAKPTTTAA